jgi:hypothetical protein
MSRILIVMLTYHRHKYVKIAIYSKVAYGGIKEYQENMKIRFHHSMYKRRGNRSLGKPRMKRFEQLV